VGNRLYGVCSAFDHVADSDVSVEGRQAGMVLDRTDQQVNIGDGFRIGASKLKASWPANNPIVRKRETNILNDTIFTIDGWPTRAKGKICVGKTA
jgi:hypothetical protein